MTQQRLWIIYATVVLLLPLPLGGYNAIVWSLFGLVIAGLILTQAVLMMRADELITWRPALWPPIIAFAIVIGWIIFQTLPIAGHPLWALTGMALGTPILGGISISPGATLTNLIRLLGAAGTFWLGLQWGRKRDRAYQFLRWFAYVSAAYAIYGLVNYVAGNDFILWYRRVAYEDDLTGTFVNRNTYATYAGMGLVAVLGLFLATYQRRWRDADPTLSLAGRISEALRGRSIVYLTILLIVAMAWLQSHSRMGFFATLVGLIVLTLVGRTIVSWRARGIAVLFALFAASFLASTSGDRLASRLGGTDVIDRIPIFSISLRAIDTEPLAGSGYGTFANIFPIFRDRTLPDDKAYVMAHNSYIELATEIGLPATALLMLAFGWLSVLCLIGSYKRQRDNMIPATAFSVTVLVAVHSLLDFSAQVPGVGCILAALLGIGNAQAWSLPRRSSRATLAPSLD